MRLFAILLNVWMLLITCSKCVPQRRNQPWSVILCKFKYQSREPRPRQWFVDWFNGHQNDSINSYFNEVSNGLYTIDGSNVYGWYTMPFSKAHIQRMAAKISRRPRDQLNLNMFYITKDLCIAQARRRGARLHADTISVVNDERTAVFCKENGVLLTPNLLVSAALAHEMTHSFHIGHSYSDRKVKIFPYSEVGEYDDRYDLMSTANALSHKSKEFGMSGPGLVGPHLDYLGWLPMHRTFFFGKDGFNNYIIQLSSLSVPHRETNDWLLVLIPYDKDEPMNYYTVEYRTPVQTDRGIQRPSVVIHRVKRTGHNFFSYIITHRDSYYELTPGTEWLDFIERNSTGGYRHVKVKFHSVDTEKHLANVQISTTFDKEACKEDEVERRYTLSGNICIGPGETPTRALHRQKRRRHFFQLDTWGLNSCQHGYVWRGLDAYDYTCVPKRRRKQLLEQKNLSEQQDRSRDCGRGLVKRAAFPRDRICVTLNENKMTTRDNRNSKFRMKYFGFFNGNDTVEKR